MAIQFIRELGEVPISGYRGLGLRRKSESGYLWYHMHRKDRLIEKVIPFAEDPFGNLLCFDYRNDDQPIIVFWEHEKAFNDKESATIYLCDTFTKLMLMLHEPQE